MSWDPYFWTQALFVSAVVVLVCAKPAKKYNPRRTGNTSPRPVLGSVCIALIAVFAVVGLVAFVAAVGFGSNQ